MIPDNGNNKSQNEKVYFILVVIPYWSSAFSLGFLVRKFASLEIQDIMIGFAMGISILAVAISSVMLKSKK